MPFHGDSRSEAASRNAINSSLCFPLQNRRSIAFGLKATQIGLDGREVHVLRGGQGGVDLANRTFLNFSTSLTVGANGLGEMRLGKALDGQESLEVFGMIEVLQLDVVVVLELENGQQTKQARSYKTCGDAW